MIVMSEKKKLKTEIIIDLYGIYLQLNSNADMQNICIVLNISEIINSHVNTALLNYAFAVLI